MNFNRENEHFDMISFDQDLVYTKHQFAYSTTAITTSAKRVQTIPEFKDDNWEKDQKLWSLIVMSMTTEMYREEINTSNILFIRNQ